MTKLSIIKKILVAAFITVTSSDLLSQTPELLPGFPCNIDNKRSFSGNSTPLIADLDKDGQKEIIVVTNSLTHSVIWNGLNVIMSNGQPFPNFPKEFDDRIFSSACGDINNDGYLDIIFRTNTKIYALDRLGNSLPGFPVNYTDNVNDLFKTVSLYDLDNDGVLEIIALQYKQISVFNNNGTMKQGWPRYFTGRTNMTPAIGDIDNDGKAEIIALTFKQQPSFPSSDSAYIRIYRHNGENFSNNWPIKLDSNYGFWEGSPSIYIDKNNTDSTFILVPSLKDLSPDDYYYRTCITKYGISGNIKNSIYQRIHGYGFGTLSIGDIDQNGSLEFFGGAGEYKNFLYSNDLTILPGWPQIGRTTFYEAPLLGKVKTGNELQILYPIPEGWDQRGILQGFNKDGTHLPWSPLNTMGLIFQYAMCDVDNDGSVEVLTLSSFNDTTSFLSIWQFNGVRYSAANNPWPMYAHDRYRTNQYGFIPSDEPVGIHSISTIVSDNFKLYQNYPNPFNPSTKIKFDVPKLSDVKIIIFDAVGREVKNITQNNLTPGSYEYQFNGENLSSGIYYFRLQTNEFVKTMKMVMVK